MGVLHASTLAALQAGGYHLVTLLKMEFSTPLYFASSDFSVAYDGDTYLGSGLLLTMGDVSETTDVRAETLEIEFTNADAAQTMTALVLNNDYIHVAVTYYKAVLDQNYAIQGDPIIFFRGFISGVGGSEDGAESRTVIECASHWVNFDAVNGRRANPDSQDIHFPGDKGFDFTGEDLLGVRRWGNR